MSIRVAVGLEEHGAVGHDPVSLDVLGEIVLATEVLWAPRDGTGEGLLSAVDPQVTLQVLHPLEVPVADDALVPLLMGRLGTPALPRDLGWWLITGSGGSGWCHLFFVDGLSFFTVSLKFGGGLPIVHIMIAGFFIIFRSVAVIR